MSDDWRVTATFSEDGAGRVLERLREHVVEREARNRLGSHVAVSAEGNNVFLYADTRDSAREADHIVRDLVAHEGLSAIVKVDRWHHLAEEWEDASEPMPRTESEREAEHEHREEDETRDSQQSGLAAWEVRVELASRGDAVAFDDRLKGEGRATVRVAHFVFVGANNEDEANELAKVVEQEAPQGAKVQTEPGGGTAWELAGKRAFSIFGGLAG
jgi:hypothetical protein